MKKTYSTPVLTTHGNVESITEFSGAPTRQDFIFFNGDNNAGITGPIATGVDGSEDWYARPCKTDPSQCK